MSCIVTNSLCVTDRLVIFAHRDGFMQLGSGARFVGFMTRLACTCLKGQSPRRHPRLQIWFNGKVVPDDGFEGKFPLVVAFIS